MDIKFKKVDVNNNFDKYLEFRKDLYVSEFGSDSGFSDWAERYKGKVLSRIDQDQWFYIHVWKREKIIGQLEFRTFSKKENVGYVHFFYIIKELRGSGISTFVHDYLVEQMCAQECKGAVLSVSRENSKALSFYKRLGWSFLRPNCKYKAVDYYKLKLE